MDGSISVEHIGKKRFDYLKIPVVLRYAIPAGKKTNIVPFAGVQLSYLLKYDGGMIVYSDNYFDMPATPKGNDFYKKTVLAIPLGFTVEYALTEKIELVSGIKLDYALTNAANEQAEHNGLPISTYSGFSTEKQRLTTYGFTIGLSYNLNKQVKSHTAPHKAPMLAGGEQQQKQVVHHAEKDTVILEGKHHHRRHASHVATVSKPVAPSNRDHVGEMFEKSYTSLIKGVVYRKGTSEILNNTKIILETEEAKIDSSITAIGGMYTLHVQDTKVKHQLYVYKKGYKPLLIALPDSLLDKHEVNVVKIQLEPDGTDQEEKPVVIVLKGKVTDAAGTSITGASILLKNNIDKTTRSIASDVNGNYRLELKKYSHYTVTALKGSCTSDKINQSTISLKESTTLELDLKVNCP